VLACTLRKTNIAPEIRLPKGNSQRKLVFQPSIFRCELLVSGRAYLFASNLQQLKDLESEKDGSFANKKYPKNP